MEQKHSHIRQDSPSTLPIHGRKNQSSSPAGEPGGAWNFTNGEGVRLQIGLAGGSGKLSTADQWNSGYFVGVTGQNDLADTIGSCMNVAFVRGYLGSAKRVVRDLPIADRMARLERYFQKTYNYDDVPGTATDAGRIEWWNTGTTARYTLNYSQMRASPTGTTFSPSDGAAGYVRNGSASSNAAATINNSGEKSGTLSLMSSVTDGAVLQAHVVLDARL